MSLNKLSLKREKITNKWGQKIHCKKLPAYSLIEISISLIVIGLILGGAIKGWELIERARVNALVEQVNAIRMSITSFYDKYNYLPGDFPFASTQIKSGLVDGNGNSVIDGDPLNTSSKAYNVWQHLSAAGFMESVGHITGGTASFGNGAPAAKVGGGFSLIHKEDPQMAGHWLLLGKENGVKGNGPLLSPKKALEIAKKFDSQNPLEGAVRAEKGEGAGEECLSEGQFNIATDEKVCVLYFQL